MDVKSIIADEKSTAAQCIECLLSPESDNAEFDAHALFSKMVHKVLNEFTSAEISNNNNAVQSFANLFVYRVREYNRTWNKIAERHPTLKPDGFLKSMRNMLNKSYSTVPDNELGIADRAIKAAIYYL